LGENLKQEQGFAGSVPSGFFGVGLSTELRTYGLSACTGLCIWDGKLKAGVMVHVPKEIGLLDILSKASSGDSPLDAALQYSLKFMYSKALGRDLSEIDLNSGSLRKHIRENCSSLLFGGYFNDLPPKIGEQVLHVGMKMAEFIDGFGIPPRVPHPSVYFKEVNFLAFNTETGGVEYRLKDNVEHTASMR